MKLGGAQATAYFKAPDLKHAAALLYGTDPMRVEFQHQLAQEAHAPRHPVHKRVQTRKRIARMRLAKIDVGYMTTLIIRPGTTISFLGAAPSRMR